MVALAACTAAPAARSTWVRLVGTPPHLYAGDAWTMRIAASQRGALVVVARLAGRRASARAREVAPRRYRATLRFAVAGTWRLTAVQKGHRFPLANVRVDAAGYTLDQPAQLLEAPDGSLLVTERGRRDRILRVDPDSGTFEVFATGLQDPWGLANDQDGSLLVSSDAGMYRVPAAGGVARRILDLPVSPFVPLPNGDLLLAHISWVGRLRAGSTTPDEFPVQVNAPHGMALAPDGGLLLTDTGNHRIIHIDVATMRATVIASGEWTPLGLALEPSGTLLVVDFDAGTLVRVDASGARSTVASRLRRPYALARARDGTVYVAESGELSRPSGSLKRVRDGVVTPIRLRPAE
jgi:sugar lactone lactonase YvrE